MKSQPTTTTTNLASPTQNIQTASAASHQAINISLMRSMRPERNGNV